MTSRCRTCGKVNYKSKKAADNAITKLHAVRRDGGGILTAYRCGSNWHVGHTAADLGPYVEPKQPREKGGRPDRWTRVEWDAATMVLWARSRDACELATCGKSLGNRVERHHRQRRAVGGDRYANLVLLHPECHAWAHAHPEEARRLGVIVSAHHPDPAEVPIKLHTGEWVQLDDEGHRRPAEVCPCGSLLPCSLADAGYAWCDRCCGHHRHPEACAASSAQQA